MVENQFGSKLKYFNVMEVVNFLCMIFLSHLQLCGIVQHVSCAGTLEQNGVAERKHRHIIETGLTMLFHSRLPKNLWIEAFMTVVYLINHLPSSKLGMITPFYKLHGVHPDYNSLKVFRCRCFPYLWDYAKNKFKPKSYPCIFIGYSPTQKGYWCLYPPTKRVYLSRHVVFDESILPYTDPKLLFSSATTNGSFSTYAECAVGFLSPHLVSSSPMLSFSSATSATPSKMLQTVLLDSSSDPTVAPPLAPTPSLVTEPELIHTEPGLVLPPPAQHPSLDLEPPEPVPPSAPEPTYTDQSTSDLIPPLEMAPPESVSPLDMPPTTLLPPSTTNVHPMITRRKAREHHYCVAFKPTDSTEPRSIKFALQSPHWLHAMQDELAALQQNHTWDLVPRHDAMNIMGSRWVFKTKLKSDGSIKRFKARLVTKGYNQLVGLDFHETFSPVIKPTTIRLALSLATTRG